MVNKKLIIFNIKKYLRKNVEGLLLISDGIINLGKNPNYNESVNIFPVHCVGVGDTSQITDIRIENVNYNPVSFQNSIITLELIVSADNLLGNNFDAKLISNHKNIQSINFLVNEFFASKTRILNLTLFPFR